MNLLLTNSIYVMLIRPKTFWYFWIVSFASLLIWNGCVSDMDVGKQASIPRVVDFNFHIRPILSDRCYACHGPDSKARKADLRLDTQAGAMAALKETPGEFAIVAGNPDSSVVYRRITSDDEEVIMPPPDSHLKLSEREKKLIKKWIEQGAEWKEHWAFIPLKSSALPKVKQNDWPENEIDHFILAKMEENGLKPSPPADPAKRLRRVSLDLTGLPPNLEEIDAVAKGEESYESAVDKLLASPAYGERMASIWLEAARYADSHGYQDDRPRTMWPWRDWVIDAFNQNMPYDSFIVHQLAGDLLPNATYRHKLATGFNRNHAITQEGGVVNEEYVTEYVADRVNTVATAFMGLTLECARCHDHKYDPLSQKEYYQMFAFFNTIDERGQVNYFNESPEPNMKVEDEELEAIIAMLDSQKTALKYELAGQEKVSMIPFRNWLPTNISKIDLSEKINEKLILYHKLDQLTDGETQNEVPYSTSGKINTGLTRELNAPVLVTGKKGKALEFDGINFLNLGDKADFEFSDPFSLGGWVKFESLPEKDAGVLVKRNGEQRRGGYQMLISKKGKLKIGLIHNQGKEKIEVETTSSISPQEWNHLWMNYNGSGKASGVDLYINGEKQRVKIITDELNDKSILNGNDLLAGNWTHRKKNRGDIQGFENGQIDEIRVYSRRLTPPEIQLIADLNPIETYLAADENEKKQLGDFIFYPYYLQYIDSSYQKTARRLDSLRDIHLDIPHVMIMEEMETPRKSYVLARGAYDALTEEVFPSTPEIVYPYSQKYPQNRLGLAMWLTDPNHPLTARVMVNRCWQMLFGKGLVETPEDFGSQGALPSHPELLDELAIQFVESGWDVKALLKEMVMSATYQQTSRITPQKSEKDGENKWLSRGPSQRLTAEMIRDQALASSGLLRKEVGGPWVKPYQPAGIWKELANQIGENKYRPSRGDGLYRRSIYTYWKRTIPPPTMLTFDAAERNVCVVKRQTTSTPLQSLVLLNDPQYLEASRMLAERMIREGGEHPIERIRHGFRIATSRLPENKELKLLLGLLQLEQKQFEGNPAKADSILTIGNQLRDVNLDDNELAAYTVIANLLLNLDETKMKS